MEVIISESKQVKEKLINALKAELEEIRRKKERAVGPDAYNYYWEKEKKLEDMIQSVSVLPNT
ncbi:MAG: hypothetical protein QXF52_06000 [Thermoproteota archaeon]